MKKIIAVVLIVVVACPFLIWIGAIAKCEILTFQHQKEFYGLEETTNMISKADSLKVLNYTSLSANVYYKNYYGGNVLRFIRQDDGWVLNGWNTVWSKMGSADGFIWPYIR
jgi:hypothetical protein